jgi:hypothetical protein
MKTNWNGKIYGTSVYIDNIKVSLNEAIKNGLFDEWMASMRIRNLLTFDETFNHFRFKCFEETKRIVNEKIKYINNLNEENLKKLLSKEDIEFYFDEEEN